MNRTDKIKLLSKLIDGKLNPDTLRNITQPTRVCSVLIYDGENYEPVPTDELKAMMFYDDGRIESHQMTYERFNKLPNTISRTLFSYLITSVALFEAKQSR